MDEFESRFEKEMENPNNLVFMEKAENYFKNKNYYSESTVNTNNFAVTAKKQKMIELEELIQKVNV